MKTAQDVIIAIDEELALMEHDAAGPCIEAVIDFVDRDVYREAVRMASAVKAVRALRTRLVDRMAGTVGPPPAKPGRKAAKSRG
jgi:hypothetical protein